MACSGCARRRAKMKAAYNRFFDKKPAAGTVIASGGLGKKFTVFDEQAAGQIRIPPPQ